MYSEMTRDALLVFVGWEDYNRFMNGETIGTRYNSEAKIELTGTGKRVYTGLIANWKVEDNVRKLTNDDYCISFPRGEANNQFIVWHDITFHDPITQKDLAIRIYWPSHSNQYGYHPHIHDTNFYCPAAGQLSYIFGAACISCFFLIRFFAFVSHSNYN